MKQFIRRVILSALLAFTGCMNVGCLSRGPSAQQVVDAVSDMYEGWVTYGSLYLGLVLNPNGSGHAFFTQGVPSAELRGSATWYIKEDRIIIVCDNSFGYFYAKGEFTFSHKSEKYDLLRMEEHGDDWQRQYVLVRSDFLDECSEAFKRDLRRLSNPLSWSNTVSKVESSPSD